MLTLYLDKECGWLEFTSELVEFKIDFDIEQSGPYNFRIDHHHTYYNHEDD